MTAPNVGLKGFKIMTDNTGMCCIEFIAAAAAVLLLPTDFCACHGACLPHCILEFSAC